jgi:hypothetical protein
VSGFYSHLLVAFSVFAQSFWFANTSKQKTEEKFMYGHTFHGHAGEEYGSTHVSRFAFIQGDGDPVKKILKVLGIASVFIIMFIAILIWLSQPVVVNTPAFVLSN